MNRFAANHPDDWEQRIDAIYDEADRLRKARKENESEADSEAPMCRVCGEMRVTDPLRGVCTRCMWALEEDRMNREQGL